MARSNIARSRIAAIAAAALVPAVAPAVASAAGSASVSSGSLYVYAGAGDANAFKLSVSGTNTIVEDRTTLTITPGAGCSAVTTYKVSCPSAAFSDVTVAAGDQSDTINVNLPVYTSLYGSSGDDQFTATGGAGYWFGGGSGTDIVNYSASTASIFASINGTVDDGPFDSGWDNISADVEQLNGGTVGDVLIGSDTGYTTLQGLGGNDSLAAGTAGADLLGGAGNDSLGGNSGNDWISGGTGTDTFDGKGGNDQLFAKDGVAETVTCGSGTDTATVDATDTTSGCETLIF